MSLAVLRWRALREERWTFAAVGAAALGVMAASVWAAPGAAGYFGAGLGLIMLAIAAIDARAFIIPDALSAAGVLLGLVSAWMLTPFGAWEALGVALLRAAVMVALFYGLRALYFRLRGTHGLGLGDVKLAAVAGVWLDWMTLPIAVEIAALSALAAIGFRYYVRGLPLDRKLKFPFGLFLAPAIWIGWLIEVVLLRA